MPLDQIDHYIKEYIDIVILAGLAVGALVILGFLPTETTILDLGKNVKFLYVGVILVSGYAYFTTFWGKYSPRPTYQSTVPYHKINIRSPVPHYRDYSPSKNKQVNQVPRQPPQ